MPQRDDLWLRAQQRRFMRPDAYRWIRPDAARFLRPGTDPADVYPALALKGSPGQPRIPRGRTGGGRWAREGVNGDPIAVSNPMGDFNPGEMTDEGAALDLPLAPGGLDLQENPSGADPNEAIAADQQTPSEEPPEIPQQKPGTSGQRTGFMRAAANWLSRNAGTAANIYTVALSNVEWLKDRQDMIQAARDPAMSYEDLQAGVGKGRPGYDTHHVVEKTWAEYFGFSRSRIDDPSNLVSIPRLKHYQITGWYAAENPDYGGRSPRQYLSDKSWEERRQVGLYALVKFGVLKP